MTSRGNSVRALIPVLPLIVFISLAFIAPLGTMLVQSVYDPTVSDIMPETMEALDGWTGEDLPPLTVFTAAAKELLVAREKKTIGKLATKLNRRSAGLRRVVLRTGRDLEKSSSSDFPREVLIAIHPAWGQVETWRILARAGAVLTSDHYLNAVDYQVDPKLDKIVPQPESRRIYAALFVRTLWVSLAVTLLCLALGYPVAYLLAQSSPRLAGVLLILVLLPFWTALLVRTTAWIVLLQQQGVINDILVRLGFITDEERLSMIYNMTGTLVAMTHILLPFAILPIYSVMRTIPSVQMQAARSLGAGFLRAFRAVYLPQTMPGVGAGCLLVFILCIGYYITPALVGGQSGQLISNLIAYHMETSLNWNLAAALGSVLFFAVVALFVLYDRVLGLDRIRVGS